MGNFVFMLGFFLLISQPAVAKKPQKIKIDLNASVVKWEGRKIAGAHHGTIQLESAEIFMIGGKPVGGNFLVDMTSIKNIDIESDKYRKKLENHLKSNAFFNVEKYPTAQFEIKKITPVGANGLIQKYRFAGPLTVKGITHRVSFPGQLTVKNRKYVFTGRFKIDRTKWDIRYNSKSFFDPKKLGDKLIYNDIYFQIEILSD